MNENMTKRNAGRNAIMDYFKEQKQQAVANATLTGEMELQVFDNPAKFVGAIAKNITKQVQNGTLAETMNVAPDEHEAQMNGKALLAMLTAMSNEQKQDYLRNTKTGMYNIPQRREQAERASKKFKELEGAIVELRLALNGKHPQNRERVEYKRTGAGAVTPLSYK